MTLCLQEIKALILIDYINTFCIKILDSHVLLTD